MNFEKWLYSRCKSSNRSSALGAIALFGYTVESASSTPFFMTPHKWVVQTGDRRLTLFVGNKSQCVNWLAGQLSTADRKQEQLDAASFRVSQLKKETLP